VQAGAHSCGGDWEHRAEVPETEQANGAYDEAQPRPIHGAEEVQVLVVKVPETGENINDIVVNRMTAREHSRNAAREGARIEAHTCSERR
jgi:hypothetical protein